MMRRFFRKILFLMLVATTTLVAIVAFLDLAVMPYLVDVPRVRSPDLRGLALPRAKSRLHALGLRLSIRDSSYHESVAAGAVLYQSPDAGVNVKKGRRLSVDVSMGRRFYAVPDVRSVSLREAQLQLEHVQLRLGEVIFNSSESIPGGAVIKQVPQHGIELPRHSLVDLEISSGSSSQPKRVPNLTGLSIEIVEDTLRKYEMRLGTIASSIDNAVPPGHVLDQDPKAGERIARLSAINLVLSVVGSSASDIDTTLVDPIWELNLDP